MAAGIDCQVAEGVAGAPVITGRSPSVAGSVTAWFVEDAAGAEFLVSAAGKERTDVVSLGVDGGSEIGDLLTEEGSSSFISRSPGNSKF